MNSMIKLKLSRIKYINEDQITKHINFTTINNQYLVRNYLQKILKCQAVRQVFGKLGIYNMNGVECKCLRVTCELLIKIRECFERVNICN